MLRLKAAPGPPVPLLKLDSEEVIDLVEFAVFCARLAAFIRKFQRNNRIRRNRLFNFEAGSGRRYIPQNCPLALTGSGFRFPLDLYQICTEFSIFLSF